MTPEHLDDDALSASLDGMATPAEDQHLAECARCRARADELRAAAVAIGAPVPSPDPADRERAVQAALASVPTPLASRARRRPPNWLLGAAAALLAVLAVGSVVRGVRSSHDDQSTTAAAKSTESQADRSAAAPSAAGGARAAGPSAASAASGPAVVGDLGTLEDGGTLAALVRPALARGPDGASPGSTTTVAPAAAFAPAPPCAAELTARDPALGPVRLSGTATMHGDPVQILVFDVPGGQPELRAYAVTASCAVLRSETFPPP